jgi:hypothetical protein
MSALFEYMGHCEDNRSAFHVLSFDLAMIMASVWHVSLWPFNAQLQIAIERVATSIDAAHTNLHAWECLLHCIRGCEDKLECSSPPH